MIDMKALFKTFLFFVVVFLCSAGFIFISSNLSAAQVTLGIVLICLLGMVGYFTYQDFKS